MGPHYDRNFNDRFGPLSGTTLLTDLNDSRMRPVPRPGPNRRGTAVLIFVALMAAVATQVPDGAVTAVTGDYSSRP